MPGDYANPKVATYEKKEEASNINKESNDMTLSNSSSTDDENERIRRGLMSTTYYTNYEHTERKLKKESSMYEDPRKSGGRI